MARTPRSPLGHTERVSVYLPSPLVAAIKAHAADASEPGAVQTISTVLEAAVREARPDLYAEASQKK